MDTRTLEQRYIRKGVAASIPTINPVTPGFAPGILMENTEWGNTLVNIGHLADANFVDILFNRHELEERFYYKPCLAADQVPPAADTYNTAQMTKVVAVNQNFKIVGTNSTSALCTMSSGGGIVLTTAGADGDQEIVTPHTVSALTSWASTTWKTNQRLAFSANVQLGASITNYIMWAGFKLTNTPTTATDDDQAFFRLQDGVNSGKFQCINSATNVDTAGDSGLTAVLSTAYHLAITLDGGRVPRFYINGALYYTGNALTTAVALIPFIGVAASGAAAAKTLTVRSVKCGKSYVD